MTPTQILADLLPTSQQAVLAWFTACQLLGIGAVLFATWWLSDFGINQVVTWWNRRRQATVSDFEERRRLRAIVALRRER